MECSTGTTTSLSRETSRFARSPVKRKLLVSTVELSNERPGFPQKHHQFRQMPCVFKEQSLLAHASGLHVAESVEHEEGSSVFEYTRAIVDWRFRSRYVVVLGTRSVQLRTPSSMAIVDDVFRTSLW